MRNGRIGGDSRHGAPTIAALEGGGDGRVHGDPLARRIDGGDGAVPNEVAGAGSPVEALIGVGARQAGHVKRRDPGRGAGTGDRDAVAGAQAFDAVQGEGAGAGGDGLVDDAYRRRGPRIGGVADFDQGAA